MGKEKKKYLSGAAAQFITRKQACNKLQLTLADFRRLCILKGIYPHEPNNRKKVGRGSTAYKTYYYKKDIQFLLHEPIINKFRQHKIYLRKLARARGREEKEKYHHLKTVHPQFKVDHIVRERYPSFIDALRDIDDALCMCNLFATLPKIHQIKPQTTHLSRRLCVEFMHYVIGSRSLKKAFISIKGYYYQAAIMNQTVTWLVPHNFAHTNFSDVDYRIMTTFTQFYTTMLGFVLYRLYQSLNLHYPPKIALLSAVDSGIEKNEKEKDITPPQFCLQDNKMEAVVASLNVPLVKYQVEEEEEKDEEDQMLEEEMTEDAIEAKKKRLQEEKFKNLFTGCKFFLSREVPKEQFVFVIKCFGGEVSWDKTDGLGSTFTVDDETITHQVADRPIVDKKYISRYYIQPQWIFDCVNARLLLPLAGYLPGDVLPPHLSPFASEEDGAYIPPERQRVIALQRGEDPGINNANEDLSEKEEDSEEDDEEEEEEVSPKKKRNAPTVPRALIRPGKTDKEAQPDPDKVAAEEKKLAVMMIPKKRRRLYSKMTHRIKRQKREAELLAQKRKLIDEEMRKEKRRAKKSKS